MLKILLRLQSKKGQFRIVVVDSRYPRTPIDTTIGYVNKYSNVFQIDTVKVNKYIAQGAKMTDSLAQMIKEYAS